MARYNLIMSMKKFFKKLLALFFKKKNQALEPEADSRQETQDTDAVKTGNDASGQQPQAPDQQPQTPGEQPQAPGEQPQAYDQQPPQVETGNVADEPHYTPEELQMQLKASRDSNKILESNNNAYRQFVFDVAQVLGIQIKEAQITVDLPKIIDALKSKEDASVALDKLNEHINKLKDKNNYLGLKLNEAREKKSSASVAEVLIDFINRIKGKCNAEDKSAIQVSTSPKISDNQIKDPDIAQKFDSFLIEILKDAGIEVDANKGRQAIIDALKALREENDAAKQRDDDDTIIRKAFEEGKLPQDEVNKLITKAVQGGKLTQEAADALLAGTVKDIEAAKLPEAAVKALIQLLNGAIGDSDKPIAECTNLGEVAEQIAALSHEASMPTDAKEAAEKASEAARAEAVKVVETALDVKEVALTEDGIKAAVTKFLTNSFKEQAEDLGTLISLISQHIKTSKTAKTVKQVLGAKGLSADSFKNAVIANECSRLQNLHKDSEAVAKAKTIESMVNALLKKIKEADEEAQKLAKKLVELITKYDGEFKADDKAKVIDLLLTYSGKVNAKEQQLSSEIKDKDSEIKGHLATISDHKSDITKLKEQQQKLEAEKKELLSESDKMVEFAQACAKAIDEFSKYTLMDDCNESGKSDTLQDSLQSRVEKLLEKVRGVTKAESPTATRAAIQKMLVEELGNKNGAINVISQYYAYSRLPFMTDSARKYGVYFNRKNMAQLFDAVNDLLIAFGIRLDIPTLFAQSATEGNYAVVNGEEYSELDNFCPQVRNHVDKIDSESKPAQIIYDMVQVGFSVDGRSASKSKVLTN